MKKVMLYALSTCGWCKKTRAFLDDNDVEYDYVYVDLLKGYEREQAIETVRKWNPKGSFPTVIVDEQHVIVGYKPEQLEEALGI